MSAPNEPQALSTGNISERRTDGLQALILMENSGDLIDSSHLNAPTQAMSAPSRPSETSSLSFVSGPTFTAGPLTQVTMHSGHSSATYIPIQVPGVLDTAFTQSAAYAAPLIYPSTALSTAYFAPGANTTPTAPSPCTLLPNAPVTAVCHCVYAQPCALHHRPITYAPHSLTALGASASSSLLPTHAHNVGTSQPVAHVQVPQLPPTLNLSSLRSSAMRLKRSNESFLQHSANNDDSDGATSSRVQKIRRINSSGDHQSSTPSEVSHISTFVREDNPPNANNTFCCECASRAACISCPCHHHVCPRHRSCICQRPPAATPYRREPEINPVHDLLLTSRMSQIERQHQADNLWFQRQTLSPGSLVGVDVVTRRISPHPFFMLPRYQQPLMELSMVLLQPHEAALVLGSSVPQSNEPLPVGATLEQINRFSTMYRYVKENNVPENELERCTVCLSEFETSEEVRSLRCAHVFHVVCIDRWLVYNKKCPVCRLDLDKAEASPSIS